MTIEIFKKAMLSEKENVSGHAIEELLKTEKNKVIKFLIGLLSHDDPLIRNRAAIILHDTKDERAKQPLLKAIFKIENRNHNGTLVYALGALNCEDLLVELFKILFYESDEAKMGAYKILDDQIFKFTRDNLLEIQNMWKNYNNGIVQAKRADEDKWELSIQDTYEGFIEYLV